MTSKFKKRVRTRMEKTGETYQAAYQALDTQQGSKVLNIVTFVTHELGYALFPVQQVLLKIIYGIPLNDRKEIEVFTSPTEFQTFTEASYLHYLYEEGRSSIAEVTPGVREATVALGRRSGKTLLLNYIMAYEVYRLVQIKDVHKRYGLSPNNRIGLTCVTTNKGMAETIHQDLCSMFARRIFDRHRANQTMKSDRFQTETDIERTGSYRENLRARASIEARVISATQQLHGLGSICVVFDELAHFLGSTAEDCYWASAPAVAGFTPKDEHGVPVNGKDTQTDGRIVAISSPNGRKGLFYDKFRQGNSLRWDHLLSLQIPTWEMNPTLPTSFYKEIEEKDPLLFRQEFGAEFVDMPLLSMNPEQEALQRTLKELTTGCFWCGHASTWHGVFAICDTRDNETNSCDDCLPKLKMKKVPNRTLILTEKHSADLVRTIQKLLR